MNILLFDVDGVLVEDRGYRAGVAATVNHYSRLMGQGDRAPDPAAIELFHAHGYTNEWDICPLAIGVLITAALRAEPHLTLSSASLDEFVSKFQSIDIGPIDYQEWISAAEDKPGRPSERVLATLADALADLPMSDSTRASLALVLSKLLTDPYDFSNAPVTQTFQEYVLGSSLFEEVYRVPPRLDVPSLLFDEDRAALSAAARSTLLDMVSSGEAHVCIYTARPSLPPSDVVDWLASGGKAPRGYSPEAELALQLVELGDLPLIAMGRMQWLAERVGTRVEYLTKPAPVQALAAIFTAVTSREAASLESAYRLVSEGESVNMLTSLIGQPIDVWVVEDAALGVHSALGAIDMLRKCGVDARLRALGVSTGGPKAEALSDLCEAVVPTADDAVSYIADHIRAAQPSVPNP